jgi:hypothetical protein
MNYLLGIDIAKEKSDNTCLTIQLNNTCLEEMKELWKIGDEYCIPEFQRKQLGLNGNNKLIITAIYGNKNKKVFMNMTIK